jgi:ABC-type nitrate/sulfonate/bicarbonate transport system substrate-binding protein
MSAPPFYQDEVKRGARIILQSKDVFGVEATMALVIANSAFAQQHPQFVADFLQEYSDAADFVQTHPDEAPKCTSTTRKVRWTLPRRQISSARVEAHCSASSLAVCCKSRRS